MKNSDLLNWVTLVVLVLATSLGYYRVWGLLYLYWALQSLQIGSVFLMTSIRRDQNPPLFWAVSGMWFLAGALTLAFGA